MDNPAKEKRHPIICANCGTSMVGMNKYLVLSDGIYIWYVCPRRKANGESGCGHKTPVKIRVSADSKEAMPLLVDKIVGAVKVSDKLTMVVQDNDETFETWLYHHKAKLKDKRVEITVRTVVEE